MIRVIETTHSEKVEMFRSLEKDELIEMLIEANNTIDRLIGVKKIYALDLGDSKLEHIAQAEKLFEEGEIFFDPISCEKNKDFVMGFDFGSNKEISTKHIFYYL